MAETLNLNLPDSLQPLDMLLQTIAESWIAYGATHVAVWGDDQMYANWPQRKQNEEAERELSVPINVGGKAIARLVVSGSRNCVNEDRLRLDADLLASKLQNQHLLDEQDALIRRVAELQEKVDGVARETAVLEASLHRFDLFRNIAQFKWDEMSLTDYLQAIRERLAELFPVESVFTWVDSLEMPQQLDAFPRPFASSSAVLSYLQTQPIQAELVCNDTQALDLPTSVQNLAAFPLIANEDIRARIGFVNQKSGDFTNADVETIRMIVPFLQQQMGQIFANQQSGQNEQIRQEMEEAFEVQNRLLSQTPPAIFGVDLYAYSRAAKHVGGDFYDYFTRYDGQLAFSVGDVSGKGVPSALMMSLTRAVLKNKSKRVDLGTPQAVMAEAVGDVYEDFMRVKMFATAFVGFLNPHTMELIYANAGHSPVIYSPRDGETRLIDSGSPPLGVLEATYPFDELIQLQPGDCLVVATDGLSEAHNLSDAQFEDGRLVELVAKHHAGMSAEALARLIFAEIDEFSEGAGQSDDQTLLILKIT